MSICELKQSLELMCPHKGVFLRLLKHGQRGNELRKEQKQIADVGVSTGVFA